MNSQRKVSTVAKKAQTKTVKKYDDNLKQKEQEIFNVISEISKEYNTKSSGHGAVSELVTQNVVSSHLDKMVVVDKVCLNSDKIDNFKEMAGKGYDMRPMEYVIDLKQDCYVLGLVWSLGYDHYLQRNLYQITLFPSDIIIRKGIKNNHYYAMPITFSFNPRSKTFTIHSGTPPRANDSKALKSSPCGTYYKKLLEKEYATSETVKKLLSPCGETPEERRIKFNMVAYHHPAMVGKRLLFPLLHPTSEVNKDINPLYASLQFTKEIMTEKMVSGDFDLTYLLNTLDENYHKSWSDLIYNGYGNVVTEAVLLIHWAIRFRSQAKKYGKKGSIVRLNPYAALLNKYVAVRQHLFKIQDRVITYKK
jgi:hypothetical protein